MTEAQRLMAAAFKGELTDSLSVHEFAMLRATDFKGFNHPLYVELRADIENRALCGQIELETRTRYELTSYWAIDRPYDPDRDSPLDRGKRFRSTLESSELPSLARYPKGTIIEKKMRAVDEQFISKAQAQHLYALDPSRWSEASRGWAGIEADKAEAPPAAVVADGAPPFNRAELSEPDEVARKALPALVGDRFVKPDGKHVKLETLLKDPDIKSRCSVPGKHAYWSLSSLRSEIENRRLVRDDKPDSKKRQEAAALSGLLALRR